MPRVATGESSIARAVRIFTAFTSEDTTLGVSEIAVRAGLPVSTASRLVAELAALGLLERCADRQVRVGVRLWELASRASPTLSLRTAAMPYMEDLHAVVGHHTQLGVLDGDDVLFIERLSARDAVINYSPVAGRLPLHVSSSGHVLLAYGPIELQEHVLHGPLRTYTTDTLTTPARLQTAIAQTRRQGYAILPGHLHEEVTGIAVPVRNGLNEVVAALSVVVPNDSRAQSHIQVLLATARGIGRGLGGSVPARR